MATKTKGRRLRSTDLGNVSANTAVLGLSHFNFVTPVPREEDFGIDLICTLREPRGTCDYPGPTFLVQVKSDHDGLELAEPAIEWISLHMAEPLFICAVDRETEELSIYSCNRLWLLLFPRIAVERIGVRYDGAPYFCADAGALDEKPKYVEVNLGPPIVRMATTAMRERRTDARAIVDAWVRMDAVNIARRQLQRPAARYFKTWTTNELPKPEDMAEQAYCGGRFSGLTEREAEPFLVSLRGTYDDRLRRAPTLEGRNHWIDMVRVTDQMLNALQDSFRICPR